MLLLVACALSAWAAEPALATGDSTPASSVNGYRPCLPASFYVVEPSPENFGSTYVVPVESSAPKPLTVPPLRYGAEVGIGAAFGTMTFVGAIVPALLLTPVPPQGGCGCPPPPRDHPCSCWAVAMFPLAGGVGASTGILVTDMWLLPDRRRSILPSLLGSLAAATFVTATMGPAYADGDVPAEAFIPTVGVSAAIAGTLTNALLGPRDGRDNWTGQRSRHGASKEQ